MCAGAALYVSVRRAPDTASVRQARLIEEGRSAYAAIGSWATVEDRAAVRAGLEALAIGGAPLDAARGGSLRDAVADFLGHRFGGGPPAEYRAWRSSLGGTPTPYEFLKTTWGIPATYKWRTGKELPPDIAQDRLFDELWEAEKARSAGRRVVRVASESRGLASLHGTMTPMNRARGLLQGAMTPEQWHGSVAMTNCSWWRPARDTRALLGAYGAAEYVDVGIIAECADGARWPIILTYLWDPVDRRWSLEHFNVNNTDPGAFEGIHY